ncbi:MAG: cupin domain-containing protein [Dehalococcoidia bacterium]
MFLDTSSAIQRDTLSEVLGAIRVAGGLFFRVQLSPPYSVASLGADHVAAKYAPGAVRVLPFHLVTRGPIWFEVDGLSEPFRLEEGDVIVLPRGAEHTLTDRPGTPSVPIAALDDHLDGFPPTLVWGGPGQATEALCGFFQTEGRIFNPLVDALPDVLVVHRGDPGADWLASTLRRTYGELAAGRPGGAALARRLTESLFVEVVQRHLAGAAGAGWFAALADPVAGPVLALIHGQPDRRWSVDALASEVGVSRTVLADRFAASVGQSPIRYLTAWRLELAGQRLLETRDSVAEVACAVGYESEAAFNRAFKRFTGQPPAAWRRAQRPPPSLPA